MFGVFRGEFKAQQSCFIGGVVDAFSATYIRPNCNTNVQVEAHVQRLEQSIYLQPFSFCPDGSNSQAAGGRGKFVPYLAQKGLGRLDHNKTGL